VYNNFVNKIIFRPIPQVVLMVAQENGFVINIRQGVKNKIFEKNFL
jgi:hypothetical protein